MIRITDIYKNGLIDGGSSETKETRPPSLKQVTLKSKNKKHHGSSSEKNNVTSNLPNSYDETHQATSSNSNIESQQPLNAKNICKLNDLKVGLDSEKNSNNVTSNLPNSYDETHQATSSNSNIESQQPLNAKSIRKLDDLKMGLYYVSIPENRSKIVPYTSVLPDQMKKVYAKAIKELSNPVKKPKSRKARVWFPPNQKKEFMDIYLQPGEVYQQPDVIRDLANKFNISEEQAKNWFKNRKASEIKKKKSNDLKENVENK